MSDPDEDQLRDLYRAGPGEQPSAELDRRILDAAAAATRRRQGRRWFPGAGGPLAGLATAAVVVLAVAVLIREYRPTTPEPRTPTLPSAARPAPETLAAPREAVPDQAKVEAEPPAGIAARGDAAAAPLDDLAERRSLRTRQEATAAEDRDAGAWRSGLEADRAERQAIAGAAPARAGSGRASTADEVACSDPFPLPDGSAVRILDGELVISTARETWTLRCVAGVWRRDPPDDQSSR